MRECRIVPAEAAHCALLAANLRKDDADEVRAFGESRIRAVNRAFRSGFMCRTAFVGDEIAAMWGLGGNVLSNVGHPWLLTTPVCERVPVTFVKVGKAQLAAMLALRPVLYDYVAAKYTRAIGFLKLLGFTISDPAPFGRHQQLFCKFELRAGAPVGH
jgi:hypothetical protein